MRLGSLALLAVCVGLLAELGLSGLERNSQRATPLVTIYDTDQDIKTPLPWGSHGALMQASFFTETRDSFIEQSISFIEVDLVAMQLGSFALLAVCVGLLAELGLSGLERNSNVPHRS